jgi:hypothetical protein
MPGREERSSTAETRPVDPPTWLHRALWILLPALASVMLLAVTNHLGQDVAVSPLMWVVPLSLYLLTFIICFDRERWYSRRWYSLGAAAAVLAVSYVQLAPHLDDLYRAYGLEFRIAGFAKRIETIAAAYLTMMFAVCMLCHGELVRLKPLPTRLTSFYLSIAVGGAIGGILVGVVCPSVFDNYHELPLAVIISFLMATSLFAHASFQTWFKQRALYKFACLLVAITGVSIIGWAQAEKMLGGALARDRNFYGVLSVQEHFQDYEPNPEWYGRALYHGRILHGYQYLREDMRRIPTTYFMENSGVGLALRNYPRRADRGLRVALVSLGAGTLACYGELGDEYTFYEINPQVVDFAREHFTFLRDCPAEVKTTLGDARLSLEAEVAQQAPPCDVLVLDAFSGDSIPTHLLTREAFQLYQQRLAPDGVICVHVSNRYLNVEPVVVRLAEDAGWSVIAISQDKFAGLAEAASDWLIITRNQRFLALPAIQGAKRRPVTDPSLPLWTDKYSNLLQIMK